MKQRVLPITVCFLLTYVAVSTCQAQSNFKGKSISTVGTGVRVGGSSSIGGFAPSASGMSSYGNLYQTPEGGGALSSSIAQINQRQAFTGGSGNPASAFGNPTIGPSGSSTKNIAAGALPPLNLGGPISVSPAAGKSPAMMNPGVTPSAATDKPSGAIIMTDVDATAFFPLSAERSGRAYAAALESSHPSGAAENDGKEPITTLVPKQGQSGRYRRLMREGEEAFRKEDYTKASQAFGIAYEISSGSSESLLSLLHVYFATARNGYTMPSYYLKRILNEVPELPLIPVHPRDFYGNVGTFMEDMIRLEEYTKSKPKDANAQLMLAYVKWRENKIDQATTAMRRALENCTNNEDLYEAIQTFWRGMVHSGSVSGKLEEVPLTGETKPSPTILPNPTNPSLPVQ